MPIATVVISESSRTWEDHAYAAKLFGWSPSSESLTTDELNEEAREFLMEHISDEITAPLHIAEHFAP